LSPEHSDFVFEQSAGDRGLHYGSVVKLNAQQAVSSFIWCAPEQTTDTKGTRLNFAKLPELLRKD
jgi:hypothetical protein